MSLLYTITLIWKLFKFTAYNNILILIGDKLFAFNLNNKLNILQKKIYNEFIKDNNNFTLEKISINIDDANYKILIYLGFHIRLDSLIEIVNNNKYKEIIINIKD